MGGESNIAPVPVPRDFWNNAASYNELFGEWSPHGEWRDGNFTQALRRTVEKGAWMLVYCGDLSAATEAHQKWAQLHTLMDDNRVLRLGSGEAIPLGSSSRILFVTRNLEAATPATISRLGVINLEAQHP